MQLAEFQEQFLAALDNPEDAKQPFYKICSTPTELSIKGLNVYRQSMQGTLNNVLGKTFAACKRLVGEQFFAQLSHEYISQFASHSFNLNHYGEHFASFSKTQTEIKSLPYFAELAQLEWQWHQVFYGPDNTLVNWRELSQAIQEQGENIVFTLASNCRLIKADYTIDTIWQACQPEYQGPYDFSYEQAVYLAIFQLEGRIMMPRLSLAEWTFLSYLSKAYNLEKLCEIMENLELGSSPAEFLPRLCQLNLIHLKP